MGEEGTSNTAGNQAEKKTVNKSSEYSLTEAAPVVHQDFRKIRVEPAFTGEDEKTVDIRCDQDDSDVEQEDQEVSDDEQEPVDENCENETGVINKRKSFELNQEKSNTEIPIIDVDVEDETVIDLDNENDIVDTDNEKESVIDSDSESEDIIDVDSENEAVIDVDRENEADIDVNSGNKKQAVINTDSKTEAVTDNDRESEATVDRDNEIVIDTDSENEVVNDEDCENELKKAITVSGGIDVNKTKDKKLTDAVQTASGKFIVSPNKYIPTKRKPGKQT